MFCLMPSFVPVWPYRATPVFGCAAGKPPGATLSALHPFLAYLKNMYSLRTFREATEGSR